MNIQPPASYLDPAISKRITWVHGNLYVNPGSKPRLRGSVSSFADWAFRFCHDSLTKRLPFDEDEFDYVRVKFIAK